MPIVPHFLNVFLVDYREQLEAWFSERLYAQLLQQARRHELVRLKAHFDFGPLEACCQGFQHQHGPGAPARYRLGQYVRALLVKYLYGWSYRQTEERLRHDLVVKWFVGFGVFEAVLDHSALCLFEQWVAREQPRAFFDPVLDQLDQALPKETHHLQIGDTFAMRAAAAQESLVVLLRHTSRLLLGELEQGAPAQSLALRAQLDLPLLFGPAEEPLVYWLSPQQRQEQRTNTGRGAWQLLQAGQALLPQLPDGLRGRVQLRLADLDKILQDEYRLDLDPDGRLLGIVEHDPKHKGEYRLCSATDPEATCRNHGGTQTVGYNIRLAVTPHGVIREIAAARGAEPDAAGVARLVESQLQARGECPDKLVFVQAAGSGRTRAEVARVSGGRTQLVARIPPSSSPGRLGPEAFAQPQPDCLVCPQQRSTTRHYAASSHTGTVFEFAAKDCRDCPIAAACRGPQARPGSPRRVFISAYQTDVRQAQAYNQTEAFRREMKLRPLVERVIFMLTGYDGARRARSRGLARADFQAKMCAAGRNLRTWLRLWDRQMAQSPV
jgi:IS5 family transposase